MLVLGNQDQCIISRVEWRAVISGFVTAYRIGTATALRIWRASRAYFLRAIHDPATQSIAVEFCTEAAVLVAVFPILDTILGNRGLQSIPGGGAKEVTWSLVLVSEGLAAFLLFLAVMMSLGRKE
jgi:hypothetical protein